MNSPVRLSAALSVALLAIAVPVVAHHDGSPAFCRPDTPLLSVTGILTQIEFSNPHVRFKFDVTDAKTGKVTNVSLELGPPRAVQADNPSISKTSFKAGDRFTVSGVLVGNNLGSSYTYCGDRGPVILKVEPAK
jgi:hypothetical protein